MKYNYKCNKCSKFFFRFQQSFERNIDTFNKISFTLNTSRKGKAHFGKIQCKTKQSNNHDRKILFFIF